MEHSGDTRGTTHAVYNAFETEDPTVFMSHVKEYICSAVSADEWSQSQKPPKVGMIHVIRVLTNVMRFDPVLRTRVLAIRSKLRSHTSMGAMLLEHVEKQHDHESLVRMVRECVDNSDQQTRTSMCAMLLEHVEKQHDHESLVRMVREWVDNSDRQTRTSLENMFPEDVWTAWYTYTKQSPETRYDQSSLENALWSALVQHFFLTPTDDNMQFVPYDCADLNAFIIRNRCGVAVDDLREYHYEYLPIYRKISGDSSMQFITHFKPRDKACAVLSSVHLVRHQLPRLLQVVQNISKLPYFQSAERKTAEYKAAQEALRDMENKIDVLSDGNSFDLSVVEYCTLDTCETDTLKKYQICALYVQRQLAAIRRKFRRMLPFLRRIRT